MSKIEEINLINWKIVILACLIITIKVSSLEECRQSEGGNEGVIEKWKVKLNSPR